MLLSVKVSLLWKLVVQASGNERAEAQDYSGAIKFWNRALLLTPDKAALHEMKAQVRSSSWILLFQERSFAS